MDSRSQSTPFYGPEQSAQAEERVRRMKLSAAAFEFWLLLWRDGERRPVRSMTVDLIALAARLGIDRTAAFRRCQRVVAAGLITILGNQRRALELSLLDPLELPESELDSRPRLRAVSTDQRSLLPADGERARLSVHDTHAAERANLHANTHGGPDRANERANLHALLHAQRAQIDELQAKIAQLEALLAHERDAGARGLENKQISNYTQSPIHPVNPGEAPQEFSLERIAATVDAALEDAEREGRRRAMGKDAQVASLQARLPGLGLWFARKVVHLLHEAEGDSRPPLPRSEVDAILETIEAKRTLPADHVDALRLPERAFFIAAVQRRCRQLEIPWPRKIRWHQQHPP